MKFRTRLLFVVLLFLFAFYREDAISGTAQIITSGSGAFLSLAGGTISGGISVNTSTAPVQGVIFAGNGGGAIITINGTNGVFTGTALTTTGVSIPATGIVTWQTGLGAITHLTGPTDQNFHISSAASRVLFLDAGLGNIVSIGNNGSAFFNVGSNGGAYSTSVTGGDEGTSTINTTTYYAAGIKNPSARATAAQGGPLTGADTNFISYTPPGSSGRYSVSGVLNMSAWTTPASFTIQCTYKDDGGVARTETLAVTRGSTGAVVAAITAIDRWFFTIPFFAIDPSATAITCSTTGTFTGSPSYSMFAQLYQVQ